MVLDAILDFLKKQTQHNLIDGCNGFLYPPKHMFSQQN